MANHYFFNVFKIPLKTIVDYSPSFLRADSKLINVKHVWLESTLGISLSRESAASSAQDLILVFRNVLL